jgi:hypothetical protein
MCDRRRYLRHLAELRSPWFYWYRGHRLVALAGMGLGLAASGLFVVLTAGIGVVPLVFALALDHLLIVLIVLYVLLRWSAPTWLPLGWADWFMVEQVLLIAVPGLLLTRVCTLGAARFADSRLAARRNGDALPDPGTAPSQSPVEQRPGGDRELLPTQIRFWPFRVRQPATRGRRAPRTRRKPSTP